MPPMLDVSDEVRAEIGAEEADRLLAGDGAPAGYDCTSCRAPGDTGQERTSTVLFLGEETAVLAFAHASCIPSQVVAVSEEQLRGAVRSITAGHHGGPGAAHPAAHPGPVAPSGHVAPPEPAEGPEPAVLGVTCGQVLVEGRLHSALVVEPASPIARPGSPGGADAFLPLLIEQGFGPVPDVSKAPAAVPGWSVLLSSGHLHAILQPAPDSGGAVAWWQAHQPVAVPDAWRTAASSSRTVLVYAVPAGAIGQQPREDLLRAALDGAAARGMLVAAAIPPAGG